MESRPLPEEFGTMGKILSPEERFVYYKILNIKHNRIQVLPSELSSKKSIKKITDLLLVETDKILNKLNLKKIENSSQDYLFKKLDLIVTAQYYIESMSAETNHFIDLSENIPLILEGALKGSKQCFIRFSELETVTPHLMRQYLDAFFLKRLSISLDKRSMAAIGILMPSEIVIEIAKYFVYQDKIINEISLIMFKKFLTHQLSDHANNSIIMSLKKIEDYIPRESSEYKEFIKFSREQIFLTGDDKLIHDVRQLINFTDVDFLHSIKDKYTSFVYKSKKEEKSALQRIFPRLWLSTDLNELDSIYNDIAKKLVSDFKEMKAKNAQLLTGHFASFVITKYLTDANQILARNNINNAMKVKEIIDLIAVAYKQGPRETAGPILSILENSFIVDRITFDWLNNIKVHLDPTISNHLMRFEEPKKSTNTRGLDLD